MNAPMITSQIMPLKMSMMAPLLYDSGPAIVSRIRVSAWTFSIL